MTTTVRSYSKINLGLAIGPVRGDGFHGLATMYQTLGLHDLVTVSARMLGAGAASRISLTTNDKRVPVDARNTCWKMVERALGRLGLAAEVAIHIEKRLPVQGGMGAGSANAAAALLGLERELGFALPGAERLRLAGEVGSDVPLFLLGGAVLGLGRGEMVFAMPDFPRTWCVVAVPEVGVSTPQAFRDWDALASGAKAPSSHSGVYGTAEAVPLTAPGDESGFQPSEISGHPEPGASPQAGIKRAFGPESLASSTLPRAALRENRGLTSVPAVDRLEMLSLAYASLSAPVGARTGDGKAGTSGIVRVEVPDLKQVESDRGQTTAMNDLAEDALLALVRTGIGNRGLQNDFEDVVFPKHPSLRQIKRQLMGDGSAGSGGTAVYAALSGSGSALFGLYRSEADAVAAQRRVQESGCKALLTTTLPRTDYWREMFAE
ncbi:hypothetical protein GCM10011507_21850 [Edaphobacter acidisoli]|uniref:4-diphosphocytidyl-2-C-methyl-D-erythritol kinase n=1 Tax=Edaphobacter acidisoli TaxID=2040573 RepID=A0A916W646_9BACT|nr:4-(cytidine 5'-diphospho)-2-C-methyl-D-erythritol kinase [Edaphobacter acidisoli]GGA69929.1 hypothetical protein GCM10011507_21850 [Edaphobacter acidisoli]